MHFLLWAKGTHQSPNFNTSNSSGENLPNSSCYFPNHKSVFPQILHDVSVSWKITPLNIFRSNILYFAQGTNFLRLPNAQIKITELLPFWNNKYLLFSVMRHNFSVLINFWLIFIRAVKSLKIYTLMGSFCSKHIKKME